VPPDTRDLTLDTLRGFALVSMTLTHAARLSSFSLLVNSPVYVDAGDLFITISGFTLGMLGVKKLRSQGPRRVYASVLGRALQLWLIHVSLMLLAVALNEWVVNLGLPQLQAFGGLVQTLGVVLSLRFQSDLFLNILPLFVVFFLVAPLFWEAIRRKIWPLALGVSALLWCSAQFEPNLLPWLDPRSGTPVFSLAAWQFAFFVGLLLGAMRERLAAWLKPHERSLLMLALLIFTLLFVFVRLQGPSFARLGLHLPAAAWRWAFLKQTWAPLRVLYTLSELVLLYAGFRAVAQASQRVRWARFIDRHVLTRLSTIGQHSLVCFVAHIPLAIFSVLAEFDERPRVFRDLYAVFSLAVIYGVAAVSRKSSRRLAVGFGNKGQS